MWCFGNTKRLFADIIRTMASVLVSARGLSKRYVLGADPFGALYLDTPASGLVDRNLTRAITRLELDGRT